MIIALFSCTLVYFYEYNIIQVEKTGNTIINRKFP